MRHTKLNGLDWGSIFENAGASIFGAGVDLTVGSTNAANQIVKGVGVGVAGWVSDPNNIGGLVNTFTGQRVNSIDELDNEGNIKKDNTIFYVGIGLVLVVGFFLLKKK